MTTQFSGLVMAYEDEQEEAFLTTQQVDEARHMQFFDRYTARCSGVDDERIQDRLARVREDVTDAFVELFDERLVEAGERLIADPSDIDAKVDFITAYHMVIEGTLALTGQHFMLDFYEKHGAAAGLREGFSNIARDEHRHVAYGTWFLQQKCARRAHARARAGHAQRAAAARRRRAGAEGLRARRRLRVLRLHLQEQAEFAYSALTRRLKVIGVGRCATASAA